jgi:TolA-binding protein
MRPSLALAACAALALAPASAVLAQRQPPPSPEQRIDRLERQVQEMQRQVYPKGRPADTAGFPDDPAATQSSVVTLDQRLDSLERQMADMVRQSEENGHTLQTLQSDIAALRTRQEQRITTLEQRMDAAAAAAAAAAAPPPEPVTEPAVVPPRGTASKPAATKPGSTKTGATKPSTTKPKGDAASAGTAGTAAPGSDAGEDAYTEAFHQFEQGNYDDAISGLKAFTAAYPKHRRVSYANLLIGRALIEQNKPGQAAAVLLSNYRSNPKGERAPDSLYWLGQAEVQLGQPAQACKAYEELQAVYGGKIRPDLQKLVADAKSQAQCS